MPYKSLAQARKFHADPKLRRYTAEFDKATDFTHLPERSTPVKPKGKRRMRAERATALTAMLAAGGNHKR